MLGIFRKKIIDELFGRDFKKNVKLYERKSTGFTPTKEDGIYLVQADPKETKKQISRFSTKDAVKYDEFQAFLNTMVKVVKPMILISPPKTPSLFDFNLIRLVTSLLPYKKRWWDLYHLLTSPASYYMDKYFESDIVKASLSVDSIIGAMQSPYTAGSAYVLLHHVIGDMDAEGSWFYCEVT